MSAAEQPPTPTRPDAMALLTTPPTFGLAMSNLRRNAGLTVADAAEGITTRRRLRQIEQLDRGSRRSDLITIDQLVREYASVLNFDHRDVFDALLDVLEPPPSESRLWH